MVLLLRRSGRRRGRRDDRRSRRGRGRRGGGRRPPAGPGRHGCGRRPSGRPARVLPGLVACAAWGGTSRSGASPNGRAAASRGPRTPPPPLGDGGPDERDRHREADRVDCVRIVHLTETCEDDAVHLITHAMTTVATVHEARCTAAIHAALAGKGLVPAEHLVDAAYVDAELLVREPRGPRASTWSARRGRTRPGRPRSRAATRSTASRSTGTRSGCAARRASCPRPGAAQVDQAGAPYVSVMFRRGRLRRLPGAAPVHARQAPGPAPEAAAAGRARGAQGRPGAARDEGGPAPLRAAGRDRGHDLAGGARLRAAPQPLPRAGQDPPAARGDRGRDQPRAPRRLVPGGPARRHPHLALRRPRAA